MDVPHLRRVPSLRLAYGAQSVSLGEGERTLTALQLFAGETALTTPTRRQHLRAMLGSSVARTSATHFAVVRGLNVDLSDLAEACRSLARRCREVVRCDGNLDHLNMMTWLGSIVDL